MSLSAKVLANELSSPSSLTEEVFEKVMIGQDLSILKPSEQFEYIKNLCVSLGMNPLTKPFELIKLNGKLVPYAKKDATEQLRKINRVSIKSLDTKIMDGIYIVTAFARLPDGREDSSTGVVSIKGLQGDALANAMMKGETKAKRRVTLSICGLGFLDESEIDSIPNRQLVNIYEEKKVVELPKPLNDSSSLNIEQLESDFSDLCESISKCETEDQLRSCFETIKTMNFKARPDLFKKLIEAKDAKKNQILYGVVEVKDEII